MAANWLKTLKRTDEVSWTLPDSYKEGMRVPGIVYADDALMKAIAGDQSLEQVANVATLPGIVYASLAMPDIHWGYGFPIGGVAATRLPEGVISPGGVGGAWLFAGLHAPPSRTVKKISAQKDKLLDSSFI